MSVIKEANILKEIPLSLVKAGQIVQLENGRKFLVLFSGKDRFLIPIIMDSWIKFNIYDVKQPDIIRVFDNKAKWKCLYVKESEIEDFVK